MGYNVELSVLDAGAVLSVNESRHDKYIMAYSRARVVANEWAARYGYEVNSAAGGFFLVKDKRGNTVAQTAVRSK